MSHDKIRAAARKRMAETGESYAAARRAVIREHQAAGEYTTKKRLPRRSGNRGASGVCDGAG